MNFYKKVRDQRLYNKTFIVNYIVRYVYFINTEDRSFLLYIKRNQVQYKAVTSLVTSDFLLDQVGLNHQIASTRYILGRALK